MGPFNIDLMACAAPVLQSSVSGEALLFFSQYACAGSAGTDVLAQQDVSIIPGTTAPASGVCFPPAVVAGHTWRNAKLMRSSSYQMKKGIGFLWRSAPQ